MRFAWTRDYRLQTADWGGLGLGLATEITVGCCLLAACYLKTFKLQLRQRTENYIHFQFRFRFFSV